MSSGLPSMTNPPENSHDIVPATDGKEKPKAKTLKPKLKIAIPLPLLLFSKKPIAVARTASQNTVSQAEEVTASPHLSPKKGLEPQHPSEIKPRDKDDIASKEITKQIQNSVEVKHVGDKQPNTELTVPTTLLTSHPVFSDKILHLVPPSVIANYLASLEDPVKKQDEKREVLRARARASIQNSNFYFPQGIMSQPDFSDCAFEVQLATGTHTLHLHSIIIRKSKVLSRMIAESTQQFNFDDQGRVKIQKSSSIFGLTFGAVVDAIRTLYGAGPSEVLTRVFETQPDPIEGMLSLTYRMVLTTKFLLAGLFLEIDPVIQTALLAIRAELNFENVEFALNFGVFGMENHSDHNPHDQEFRNKHTNGTFLGLGTSVYGYYSTPVLIGCLDFLVQNFPTSFVFNKDAPPSPGLGAVMLDEDVTISNMNPSLPRPDSFSTIQLGEFNSAARRYERISTLLISAPFPILEHLYSVLAKQGRGFNLEEVLTARNARYQSKCRAAKVLQAEIRKKESSGEEIPVELFVRSMVPNRAQWREESVDNGYGPVKAVRVWLGEAKALGPLSPPEALSARGMDDLIGTVGGFNWANDMEMHE